MKRRRRILALLLSVVPGWGHVYWGRERVGLAIFTAAAVLAFAWINGLAVYQGAGRGVLVWGAGVGLVAFALIVWVELFRRTRATRVGEEEASRERLLERGAAAYLHGELDAAIAHFSACLRIDPQDVEALFRIGIVHARHGDAREARRWLRRTVRHDLEDKWRWEIERELARLRGGVDGSGGGPGSAQQAEEEEAEITSA